MLTTRPATEDDLRAITDIYNEAIRTTTATFDTQEKSLEEQRVWFRGHQPDHQVMVAELDEGEVVGWASLSAWSDRCAYSDTAELSFYVKEEQRGKGVGRALLTRLLQEGERAGFHTVVSRIAEGSGASVHLHQELGFSHIGVMREVGRKFGRLLDVHLMQKIFSPGERDGE